MENRSRTLICQNDVIEATKQYNTIELKVFYNMLYCCKEQSMYEVDFQDCEETYMELSKLDDFLGKKHFSKTEVVKIIAGIPKGIYFNNGLKYVSVFDYIEYDEDTLTIEFRISEIFRPFLFDVLEKFTVLQLKELSTLNSVYSQRLFEFASKNKNLKKYLMPINDFKEYFKIPKSYSMCNIDQTVIEVAVNEVNLKTEFNISTSKRKNKNKITHIEFEIQKKAVS